MPIVMRSMSALMSVSADAGSTEVRLKSVALLKSIDIRPPRIMVTARKVRCWYWPVATLSDVSGVVNDMGQG